MTNSAETPASDDPASGNFIRTIIDEDLATGKNGQRVATRFPPEPNGYLHIGHAKSICLNFGIAKDYNGSCNLRFDDTNPEKESSEYMEAIKADVEWLGFQWAEQRFASDYFQQLYDYALKLINDGNAYVDSSSADEIRELRGTLSKPGVESSYRNRSVEENLDLFQRMKDGEFEDGTHVLRAKIDMAAGNLNMRDPVIYRIRRAHHFRTGDAWNIYPMYDYTHCLSDAIENITHSLCTLEFEDHRPLYDWVLETLDTPAHPQQIEFARLSLEYTVLSKRRLIQLVEQNHVDGWDDPRMPTLSGLRRRGFTPASIRGFCESVGITKRDAWIEMAMLETCLRDPIKVVITDFSSDTVTQLDSANHPQNESFGRRPLSFSNELYIDRDDFSENPPPKYQRLTPGGEVRLRGCYVIKCNEVIKDDAGNITELRCTHDANTLGKKPEGRKVKGVVHWVDAASAVDAEVRLFDPLFNVANPAGAEAMEDTINAESKHVLTGCKIEKALAEASPETSFQFERLGYFVADRFDHSATSPVFNRTITLRDSWKK